MFEGNCRGEFVLEEATRDGFQNEAAFVPTEAE
jgi:hypothetical protein